MAGFAKIRDGLKEHLSSMPPMEAKIYLIQHLEARRAGPDRGKIFTNISRLSIISGHKRDHVRRALNGLESKGYIEPIQGGWRIVNFNGNEPIGVARKGACPKTGHGPKRGKKWPEKGQGGGPKRGRGVARKGADDGCKSKETQQDSNRLDDKKETIRGDVEGSYAATPPVNAKPPVVDGVILWAKDADEEGEREYLLIDSTFKRSVHQHLRRLAERMCAQDKPGTVSPEAVELTKPEYEDVIRKLTDICIRDTRIRALESSKDSKKRAFKTFCVHRFEEALSYKHQRLARYSSPARASPTEPRGFDAVRRVFGKGGSDG